MALSLLCVTLACSGENTRSGLSKQELNLRIYKASRPAKPEWKSCDLDCMVARSMLLQTRLRSSVTFLSPLQAGLMY